MLFSQGQRVGGLVEARHYEGTGECVQWMVSIVLVQLLLLYLMIYLQDLEIYLREPAPGLGLIEQVFFTWRYMKNMRMDEGRLYVFWLLKLHCKDTNGHGYLVFKAICHRFRSI